MAETTLALFLVTRFVELVVVCCMNPLEVEILRSSPDNGLCGDALLLAWFRISDDLSVDLTSVASEVERLLTVVRWEVLFSHIESLVVLRSDVDHRRFGGVDVDRCACPKGNLGLPRLEGSVLTTDLVVALCTGSSILFDGGFVPADACVLLGPTPGRT